MKPTELSAEFDVLYNNISSNQAPGLNEYEKSLMLTRSQEEVVVNLYNGNNIYGNSFESTEEMRRYLNKLVKTVTVSVGENNNGNVIFFGENQEEIVAVNAIKPPDKFKYVLIKLPEDVAYITTEHVVQEIDCVNSGNKEVKQSSVLPTTQDSYNKIIESPFKGPTKYKALRLDLTNNVVEIISKYKISEYSLTYLSLPEPIILEDLTGSPLSIRDKREVHGCDLSTPICNIILERAVQLAIQTMNRQ